MMILRNMIMRHFLLSGFLLLGLYSNSAYSIEINTSSFFHGNLSMKAKSSINTFTLSPFDINFSTGKDYSSIATNDYLYVKVNAITFYPTTASGVCSGAGRTLSLSDNNWLGTKIEFGGKGMGVSLGRLRLFPSAIKAAATQLNVTTYNCVEIEILYGNGNNVSVRGNRDITTLPQGETSPNNPPFILGNITLDGSGNITAGTPHYQNISLAGKGVLEFEQDVSGAGTNFQPSILLNLDAATSKELKLKNIGYSDITGLSLAYKPEFSADFTNDSCNSTLGAGQECGFTFEGTGSLGHGVVEVKGNDSVSNKTWVLPFELHTTSSVKCWGDNAHGQLGDGTNTDSNTPQQVSGLTGLTTQAVTAGNDHSCIIRNTGVVNCWGNNTDGELGNGTNTDSNVPVQVSGLTSITAITADARDTCALTSAGAAKCWGDNNIGQLGNGTTGPDSNVPVQVMGLTSGVVAISSGDSHTCAITDAGGVKCWGWNNNGQLGNGTSGQTTSTDKPVQVTGLTSGIVGIDAGYNHTCALTNAGAVKCWGRNTEGELGNGTNTNSDVPVQVSGLTSGVVMISENARDTCALTDTGAVKCWGDNNVGQLGNGNTGTGSNIPVQVSGLTGGVVDVVADTAGGDSHTCAIIKTSPSGEQVKCWGWNNKGQLGNGNTGTDSNTPVLVVNLNNAVSLAAGYGHTCAITSSS